MASTPTKAGTGLRVADPTAPGAVASVRPGMSRRDFLRGSVSALAAPLFLSCGNTPTEPGSDPRLTARPGVPTEAPVTGLSDLGLGSNGRDGLLYVPESYSPDVPAPLFIGLHGAGGAAGNWESYPARAESRGMIFLAPDSRSSTWDVLMGGFGPDVEFLDRALQHTFQRCRVDPGRIALGGFSDGASYALSLGLPNGDLFSHLTAYSPGFYVRPEQSVGRPAIFVSHGTDDNILPVSASRDTIVPTLRDAGYDVNYQEFVGGHEVPAEISEAALDWFLG